MAKFKIWGKDYEIPDEFDMGELAEIEQITGQGYDMSRPGALGTLALMYVAVRRVDPTVTVDALRKLKVEDLNITREDEAADADPPAPTPSDEPEPQPDENDSSDAPSSPDSDGNQEGRLRAIGAPL
jgi:hypothetical protein